MIPICEQGADSRCEGERLVQHDVMLRFRDLNHRHRVTQKAVHVAAHFVGKQQGFLASHNANPALYLGQSLWRLANREAAPDVRIELPDPPLFDLFEGMPRHIVDQIMIVAKLRWHKTKPR